MKKAKAPTSLDVAFAWAIGLYWIALATSDTLRWAADRNRRAAISIAPDVEPAPDEVEVDG